MSPVQSHRGGESVERWSGEAATDERWSVVGPARRLAETADTRATDGRWPSRVDKAGSRRWTTSRPNRSDRRRPPPPGTSSAMPHLVQ